jgi:hypothetical protein
MNEHEETIKMIGQCMRYQKDNGLTFDTTIAWTPNLVVQTESRNAFDSYRVPLLSLKLDGPIPRAQKR